MSENWDGSINGKMLGAAWAAFKATDLVSRGPQVPIRGHLYGATPAVQTLRPPPSTLLPEFTAVDDATAPEALGPEVVRLIDEQLPVTGALLLRSLPVKSSQDFRKLLDSCRAAGRPEEWREMMYESMSGPRDMDGDIQKATNIPAAMLLAVHNEMVYFPRPPTRFLLLCLRPAQEGGESLIARNEDLTACVPPALLSAVKEKGVKYEFRYFDRDMPQPEGSASEPWRVSWQARLAHKGITDRAGAERFFQDLGFTPDQIVWEPDGTLVVSHVVSGLAPNGMDWCNVAHATRAPAGDGSPLPDTAEYLAELFRANYAFKMQPGDLLVLDNFRVAHGRLAYEEGPEPRNLLTVLLE